MSNNNSATARRQHELDINTSTCGQSCPCPPCRLPYQHKTAVCPKTKKNADKQTHTHLLVPTPELRLASKHALMPSCASCFFASFLTPLVPCMSCFAVRWVLTLLRSPFLHGIALLVLRRSEPAKQKYRRRGRVKKTVTFCLVTCGEIYLLRRSLLPGDVSSDPGIPVV